VKRVLFVGQIPETVDYSDPALPPHMNAEKINAGIAVATATIAERGWAGDVLQHLARRRRHRHA
jgi:hypothetical protein